MTFHWYNQCATSEDAGAQFNVGQCFELGIGQKVNMDEAIAWYKKSAAKGNQDALDKLSVL